MMGVGVREQTPQEIIPAKTGEYYTRGAQNV